MREYDLDLIAALVEGRLEDESEARALIESSPKHRAEFEAQKLAYDTLNAIGTAELTEHEKAALHRDVWTELQVRPTAAAKKQPWYLRFSYAAAGVLVVAGVAGMVTQGGDDQAAETFSEVAEPLESQTDEDTRSGDLAESDDSLEGLDAGAAANDGADGEFIPPAATFFTSKADETREEGATSDGLDELAERHAACIADAGLAGYETIGELEIDGGPADLSGIYLVAKPVEVEVDNETPIAFVDLATCELAYLDE